MLRRGGTFRLDNGSDRCGASCWHLNKPTGKTTGEPEAQFCSIPSAYGIYSAWERIEKSGHCQDIPLNNQGHPTPSLLPVQWWHAVLGFQAAPCRHHVEAVCAVTLDVQVGFGVPVFHHHNETRPAVRQVVAGHPLATLQQAKQSD